MLKQKVRVRVSPEVYARIEELAYLPDVEDTEGLLLLHENGVPRYAEVARVLLVSEFLSNTPFGVQIAAAVLSNSTLILSGALAAVTRDMQDTLEKISSSAAQVDQNVLTGTRTIEKRKKRERGAGDKTPVLNLTFDGWLFRKLGNYISGKLEETNLKGTGKRSKEAYIIDGLLQDAVQRSTTTALMAEYARAVRRIRTTIENAVAAERKALQKRLV
jgi:hypothetical protein